MKYTYKVGKKKVVLTSIPEQIAVRFKEPAKHSTRAAITKKFNLGAFGLRIEVPEEKYTILPVDENEVVLPKRQQAALNALEKEDEVARATPVFKVGQTLVLATDRILLGVKPGSTKIAALLKKYGGSVIEKKGLEYIVQLDEAADPIEIAQQLAKEDKITYAEPDFVIIGSHIPGPSSINIGRMADPRANEQYAITITKAVEAWQIQKGDPAVVIAILDEGVDSVHEDLAAAIIGGYDATDQDTFQEPNNWDGHGTACAGLAAAVHDNNVGVMGIGGGCSLLAVRIAFSESPSTNWVTRNSWIADAIDWSWQNGASVISNSWGGGVPSTAIVNAFERARTEGRDGKGCVVVAAAGNASEAVSFPGNQPNILAVSASNEFDEFKTEASQDGETWWGSNFGPEIDIAAPGVHNLTTDISGSNGYSSTDYTIFNGTSSATPIVAGAAALVLSANPELTEQEVREALKNGADKVGGFPYVNGRNDQFGFGRLNVLAAVQAVQPIAASYVTLHKVMQDQAIKDQETTRTGVFVGDVRAIQDIKVIVEIVHTYIGDLQIWVVPPDGSGEASVLLHDRAGQGQDDLMATYDQQSSPGLGQYIGKHLPGEWALEVKDTANQDEGRMISFALELTY